MLEAIAIGLEAIASHCAYQFGTQAPNRCTSRWGVEDSVPREVAIVMAGLGGGCQVSEKNLRGPGGVHSCSIYSFVLGQILDYL